MSMITKILLGYLAVINLFAYGACLWDKQAAKRKKQRISEKSLLLLSVLGGSLGFLIGMLTARHKTKHYKFTLLVPLLLILWVALLVFLQMQFRLFF